MKKTFAKSLLIVLLIFALIHGMVAVFHFKQLFNDGAYWAMEIANYSTWHIEVQFFRLLTLLLQTPAVLAAKFTNSLSMTPLLFCLGYFIYPFIILGILAYHFRASEKFEYFYVLILTFFVAIVSNWTFSVSIVNESIVVGWCLSTYIIFVEKPKTWVITIFSTLLLFTYEIGIAFYGLAFYLLFREKKLKWSHFFIFLVLGGLQIYNVFSKILPHDNHKFFISSLEGSIYSPLYKLALASTGILFLSIFTHSKMKYLLVLALPVAYYICSSIFHTNANELGWQSYVNRTWAIPAAIVLLLLGYESLRSHQYSFKWYHFAVFCLLSAPSALMDFKMNQSQIEFDQRLTKAIQLNAGCKVLTPQEWKLIAQEHPISTWSFPSMSLLYNKELKIKTILFAIMYDDKGNIMPHNLCKLKNGNIWIKDQFSDYTIGPIRLDFKDIYQ